MKFLLVKCSLPSPVNAHINIHTSQCSQTSTGTTWAGQGAEIDSMYQPNSDEPVESVNLQLTVKLFPVLYYSTFCFIEKANDVWGPQYRLSFPHFHLITDMLKIGTLLIALKEKLYFDGIGFRILSQIKKTPYLCDLVHVNTPSFSLIVLLMD